MGMVILPMRNHNNHNFKKKYGQNFIQEESIIDRIVSSIDLNENDLVIEIGPGQGVLTKRLIEKCNVIAYEIDKELEIFLSKIKQNNLKIIWDDFLKRDIYSDIKELKYEKLYVIANIPYYITTPIITKLIDDRLNLEEIIVMVQKEVADRFSSKPSSKDYSSITVYLNYYFEIKKLFDVDKKYFYPIPKVDSSVILLHVKKERQYVKDEEKFFNLFRDSFMYKRKTLRNNLKSYDLDKINSVLSKYNMDLSIRAEAIPLDIFIEIANIL